MIQVSCGIVINGDKILVAQRAATAKLPLKWEFPGGKLEDEETAAESLVRELQEELNIHVKILQKLTPVSHNYPDFSICLHPFVCKYESGKLENREHEEIRWVSLEELPNFDWAAADIPIVEEFVKLNM